MTRIVADANVYVSAAISPRSTSMRLIEAAQRGEVTLVMCDVLHGEVEEVLEREKFRRWITIDEATDFLAAITLLAEWVDDRPAAEIPLVCTDPDDNYLVALCQDAETNVLVSGDAAVLRIVYPNVQPYSPADALDLINFHHEWGEGFIPGNPTAAALQIAAEGSAPLLDVYIAFQTIFEEVEKDSALAQYALTLVAGAERSTAFS